MALVDIAKKCAAYAAVDKHILDNYRVGIGSGSTVVYAAERLGERVRKENLNVVCVPTSFQAKRLIVDNKLNLSDLEITPQLDVAIDGADEADHNLNLIKGGGGCLLQEKVVASAANKFVVIASLNKLTNSLGDTWHKGVPIEVVPMAYKLAKIKIESLLGGEAVLREAKNKAGPVVTDNGNFLLDWKFSGQHNWAAVDRQIKMIPGVVETGLFLGMASKAYFGKDDGTVEEKEVELNPE